MKIVVDTNIVFSGIINPNGAISDILLNSHENFDFYAPSFILEELENHHEKLKSISKLSDSDIVFLRRQLLRHIELIDVENIYQPNWKKAVALVKDVDEFDAPFLALSIELEAPLWTGDKKLANGLSTKGIDWILNVADMASIRDGKK